MRKYASDSTGGPEWTQRFRVGDGYTIPYAACADSTGVYLAGAVFDTSAGASAFVRKVDLDGNELWTRTFGAGEGSDAVYAAACDGTGMYIAGKTSGAFPGYTNSGYMDVFLRKYDTEGTEVRTYQFGTGAYDWPGQIALDDTALYVAVSSGFVVKLQLAPTLTVVDQTVEATGASGAPVCFTPTATDWTGAEVQVTCDTASGSTFPLGTTIVNCSVTDRFNTTGWGSFTVTVVDTIAPTLTVPDDVSATATVAEGAYVTFSPTATDLVDGSVSVTCAPTSGSLFRPGTSHVSCSATDRHGNTATGSLTVTVSFGWSGYLQPVNANGTSTFKLGSTVPVKFRLAGDSAAITNVAATISIPPVSDGIAGTEFEAVSTAAADLGNTFRYDPTAGQYIFNWGTKSLGAGTYQIRIECGDGVPRTVMVSLKK